MYQVREVAQMAKVSVRTLHHYDSIGLLCPQKQENGYRLYSDEDLERLQSILYYRYLGFSLKKIAGLLERAEGGRLELLQEQLGLMEAEQVRLSALIDTLRKTIKSQKGQIRMSNEEKFAGFTWQDNQEYDHEARERYGDAVVDESHRRQAGHEEEVAAGFNKAFFALARNLEQGIPADDAQNQAIAEGIWQHIRTYSFDCSLEVFGCIGRGYSADPRFRKNIDRFGEGVAQYASDAIAAFVAARS